MKIIFLSNYFTHHQSALSKSFFDFDKIDYMFIETEPMEEERKNMGWKIFGEEDFVINHDCFSKNPEQCQELIDGADVVIIGSAPYELVRKRIKQKKLTFFYSERIYKRGYQPYKFIVRYVRFLYRFGFDNVYLLCSSAYTAADYNKTFTFKNRAYKWGYFPETARYDNIDVLIDRKKKNSILWVARLIDLKHPELAIEIAKRLKAEGYDFNMNIIGTGVLEDDLKRTVSEENLEEYVHMLGSMSPEDVRTHMEQSEIFLFTSDRNEGWGAVLNESMNSACAVVASHAIGSVPFLLKDKENGLIYQDGNIGDLYNKTKWLLDHPDERRNMSYKAYYTIAKEWNAENAAKKFIVLADRIISGEKSPNVYNEGICSKAEILKDDWYGNKKRLD